MPDMTLPQAWLPDEQNDELAGITESDIERRIRSLKAQLPQAKEHVRADFDRIAGDEQRVELAREIVRDLEEAGTDVPANLRATAEEFAQQEAARAVTDLQHTAAEAKHMKWLHDEIAYGEAWIGACNHLRELQQNALRHLTGVIEKLAETASQLTLPGQGLVVLALPGGEQEFDIRVWQQKTVDMGKRVSQETKELTVKLLAPPRRAEEKSNVVLRAAFKIAQFLYHAITLGQAGGNVLLQAIHDARDVLGRFLALLPATILPR